MNFAIAYGGGLLTFLILDGLWLGLIARSFYFTALDGMMRENPIISAAAIFYVMYVVAVVMLAVLPNAQQGVKAVMIAGAVLGFAAYGTYDMTNYSVMKDWPLKVSLVDWVWGTVVTSLTAAGGYYALKTFGSIGS